MNPEELYIAVLGSDKPISGGTANRVRMLDTTQQSVEFYSAILMNNFLRWSEVLTRDSTTNWKEKLIR